jgi:phosphosulfolactate synthase (CoM biosynthesis protein A)
MPQYATIHHAPGLSQEEFMQNAPDVVKGTNATMVSVAANVFEGFIVTVYEADDEAALIKEFERLGFPYDEIHEVQLNISHDQLAAMVEGSPTD